MICVERNNALPHVMVTNPQQLRQSLNRKRGPQVIGKVSCSIKTVSLDQLPPRGYSALSYVWGTGGTKTPITVNGHQFEITSNLDEALRYLQIHDELAQEDGCIWLWIDAISINQLDNEEKNWQVRMMSTIYEQAKQVVSWLGPEREGSGLAMDTFLSCYKCAQVFGSYKEVDEGGDTATRVRLGNLPAAELAKLSIQDHDRAAAFGRMFGIKITGDREIAPYPIREVQALLKRDYFSRVWILQEYVLATEVVIACGSRLIPGDALLTFLHTWDVTSRETANSPLLLDERPFTMQTMREANTSRKMSLVGDLALRQKLEMLIQSAPDILAGMPQSMQQLKDEMNGQSPDEFLKDMQIQLEQRWSLASILKRAAKADLCATDVRDKIFALLGLASDADKLGIEIDYSASNDTEKLLRYVAGKIMAAGDMSLLPYCRPTWAPLNWPSWIPYWPGNLGFIPLRECGSHSADGSTPFRAAGSSCALVGIDAAVSEGKITIGCVPIDVVGETASPRMPIDSNDITPDIAAQIVVYLSSTFEKLLPLEGSRYPGAGRKAAIWRTLILDNFRYPQRDWTRADPKVEVAYDHLVARSLAQLSQDPSWKEDKSASVVAWANTFFISLMSASNARQPFVTESGFVGLGPLGMEKDDLVGLVCGCEVPFVIRRLEAGWQILGEAYVHGLMDGEAFEEGDVEMIEFV